MRNVERPLPPLPQIACLVESPDDDSDVEEDIDDISDNDSSDEDLDDELLNDQTTKLPNGTKSNGSNECEDSFNADATLPPSPTKDNTSLTEFESIISNSSSSHEMPSSPENERFYKTNIFIRTEFIFRKNLLDLIFHLNFLLF